jgi:methionyl-tRNA formyltransferase
MRTTVVGNRALTKHVLEHLLRNDWNIVGAVSAGGSAARKQAGYVPFGDLTENHNIRLIETTNITVKKANDTWRTLIQTFVSVRGGTR